MMAFLLHYLILPLIVIRRLIWWVIWHSIYFFLKRPKIIIAIFIILISWALYSNFLQGKYNFINSETIKKPSQPTSINEINKPSINSLDNFTPNFSNGIYNGNSVFSKNILSTMQKTDKIFYNNEFMSAMEFLQPYKERIWKSSNTVYGIITAEEKFYSNTHNLCRKYSEILSINAKNQKIDGISCKKQDNSGWCKLSKRSTLSCELKFGTTNSSSFWYKIKNFFR